MELQISYIPHYCDESKHALHFGFEHGAQEIISLSSQYPSKHEVQYSPLFQSQVEHGEMQGSQAKFFAILI